MTLGLVKFFEREVLPRRRMLEIVLTLEPHAPLDQVEQEAKAIVARSRVLRISHGIEGQSLVLTAQPQNGTPITAIGERLRGLPGVHGVEISR